MTKGYLVLENGDVFEGNMIGGMEGSAGEVVFNTSMTGYQEIVSDPSYAGQILVFCYPMIGNYGMNALDYESNSLHLSGVVIGEHCEEPSHYLSKHSFSDQLVKSGVPGISGIDTRALVKKIRNCGTLKGRIMNALPENGVLGGHSFNIEADVVGRVSVKKVQVFDQQGPHIVLIDYGYKKSILNALLANGCKVTVVPYSYSFLEIKSLKPDGVLLSNGPGDPAFLEKQFPEIKKITENFPTLGICLGHQLIAHAYGADTKKMKFGHRGANHPVKELSTGKVWITSQNHGYEVIQETVDETI
ncbi:MAG: carbamoyl phosphate synthase small subunit, partial [Bacillota bacterium]|nr:carbamoyl phosphate synthase small subunit [Bacillota bacterium]